MASTRPVVVRAVLIGSDRTADESEILELHGCLAADGRPDPGPWRMSHRRAGSVVCDASLDPTAEGWAVGAGEDCDAPLRHLAVHALRPGEYLTLHAERGGDARIFRIVNVTTDETEAPGGAG